MSTPLVPNFKWAENGEQIFLTVELSDASDVKVDMTEQSVKFSAASGDKTYALDLALKNKIDPTKSTFASKGREVQLLLVKAEDAQGWWNALLADKNAYKGRVKIDWDLWRDEDDEEEKDLGDFGMGGMGGMPGMGMGGMGMGGMGMPGMGGMGMGGMGGMGGLDMAKMMEQMQAAGGMGGMGDMEGEEGDSDDDELPDLENAEEEAKPAEQ